MQVALQIRLDFLRGQHLNRVEIKSPAREIAQCRLDALFVEEIGKQDTDALAFGGERESFARAGEIGRAFIGESASMKPSICGTFRRPLSPPLSITSRDEMAASDTRL